MSDDPAATLVTYALGSCIAVTIFDPVLRVGGLLHYMLPDSKLDEEKARERPFMFADTGIPLLFQRAHQLGAVRSRLEVAVLGGAQVMDTRDTFNIGKRNHLALRKIFCEAGIPVHREDIGGSHSRTVRLEISGGRILIRRGQSEEILEPSTKRKGASHGDE
ncbi:MAG TPA: chemotaxis protein CheD [Edaphobacter sp.]|nr:chemotaxis protein CheD [Edaphobacter sp.]